MPLAMLKALSPNLAPPEAWGSLTRLLTGGAQQLAVSTPLFSLSGTPRYATPALGHPFFHANAPRLIAHLECPKGTTKPHRGASRSLASAYKPPRLFSETQGSQTQPLLLLLEVLGSFETCSTLRPYPLHTPGITHTTALGQSWSNHVPIT